MTSLLVVATSAPRKSSTMLARDIDLGRGAALLPLQAECRPRDARRRDRKVRACRDECRVLPAHLGEHGPHRLVDDADLRRMRHSDRVRSGEGEAVDARMTHERLAGLAPAVDEVEHAIRQSAFNQRLDHQPPGQAGRVARFEHHCIAGDQRRRHHPERQRDREIERRDHSEHAIGPKHDAAPLGGRRARRAPRGTRRCAPSRRNNGG